VRRADRDGAAYFQTYRGSLESAILPAAYQAIFGVFLVLEGYLLIWTKVAIMNSGQSSIWQRSRASCHGRHVDSPLPGSADNRQSLSSRTQYRAEDDRRSLDAVRLSSPCAPLAGLAAWRDDDPKCGQLYFLPVRV
jgi:hypothetical protein